ncbi:MULTISPECIES: hypothetical protein [Bacillaceae]|uniref:hypothetical protein n=1 Tax=Bacillaceae TaxID=186817 RepID=UPI000BFBDA0A|nr:MULTISPECIES: hypothetical protein [Bacillaceae]PGT77673.1 hypothetical protein COD11_24680 [Bacillus sp. AFS040349]UGB29517.1 hypothetical protein LPC09_17440 [Metabacillus sp. B2-18]
MKTKWMIVIILALITSGILYFSHGQRVRESIIFFPITDSVAFTTASTSLEFVENMDDDEYVIEWDVTSFTDKVIFLRQDLSLLFSDGKLIDTLSEWEDQSQKLAQFKKVNGEDSSHYEAISLHYGEIHLEDDQIRSTQQMTSDHLYVIDSEFTNAFSFKNAQTEEELEWKDILDKVKAQHLEYSWNHLINHYQINKNEYEAIPLTELARYNTEPLLGLSKAKTQEVIGSLWEGLYKNYFLGLKTKEGKVIEPIGSAMPLLLFAKDYSHILVLIQAEDGTPFKFIQNIKS